MLKKRLIPCMILQQGYLVQSYGFNSYRVAGKPRFALERFIDWDVDEIIFIDISATPENDSPSLEEIKEFSKKCFVPLTVGGGIKTTKDIRNTLKVGADKVCINTIAVRKPSFITEASNVFGSQCIVISIDAKKKDNGNYEVITGCGKEPTGMEVTEWAKKVEKLGAGEIFLNSIDNDGTKKGYDTNLIRKVADSVSIPVIACGGVGKMGDFVRGIKEGHASAVSAANIFQHSEHSTIKAKAAMKKAGIDVRISTAATYLDGNVLERTENR